jgi:hypothetical protein
MVPDCGHPWRSSSQCTTLTAGLPAERSAAAVAPGQESPIHGGIPCTRSSARPRSHSHCSRP